MRRRRRPARGWPRCLRRSIAGPACRSVTSSRCLTTHRGWTSSWVSPVATRADRRSSSTFLHTIDTGTKCPLASLPQVTDLVELPIVVSGTPAVTGGHVIVCGLRGIGMRIVEQLYPPGEQGTVLTEFADRAQLEVVAAWGVRTVVSQGNSAA